MNLMQELKQQRWDDHRYYHHNRINQSLPLGIGAIIFRTVQLFVIANVATGLAWFTRILTDPFHDIMLYHKAPIQALRGDLYDPIVVEETDHYA